MFRRRHLVGSLIVGMLLTSGGAAAVMLQTGSGPFPSDEEIARNGFSVWPVDTPEEAREECATAPAERKDPEQVALDFASQVMGYPEPTASDDYNPDDENVYRALINTEGVKGVFLGSVLQIERFGECWYVTEGIPREGDRGIDVATFEGGTKLLVPVGCCGTRIEVGWGDWTQVFESQERSGEILVDIPPEAHGRPGHFIVTDFDENGVSEVVGARTLPPLPTSEGAQPLAQIDVGRRPPNRALCRMSWAERKGPERIMGHLRNWTFKFGLDYTGGGYLRYDRNTRRRLGSDFEWRVRLDEADMRFSFSRVPRRCWIIRSIVPRGPAIIEQVSAGNNSLTFDLDPGDADTVIVYYGVGGEAQPVSIATDELLGQPFSVSRGPDFPPRNEGTPTYALAVTYRNGNLHSAEYRMFEPPPGG